MFIIYGRRGYGRVHEWGSEWAQTSFAHLWFMPLFPLRTIWVRERADGSTVAIPARMSGQSVAVTYLRMWGPIAAIAFAAFGGFLGAALALAVLVLCVLAWTSRSLRSPSARRRSDFNLLAFGTRCDPVLMPDDIRASAQLHLEARHRGVAVPRPPDDVARFGPVDLDEAVIAYGLLRLGALAHAGGAESEAVAQLLAASHEPLEVGDGPYRERDVAPASDALHAQVQAAAAVVSERVRAAPAGSGKRPSVWKRNARIGFGLSAIVAVGALLDGGAALLPARTVTVDDLAQDAPNGRFVEVTCDDVSPTGQIISNSGKTLHETYSCALGERHLVLLTPPDAISSPSNHVFGKLGDLADSHERLPVELRTDPGALPSYLDVRGRGGDLAGAILGLACSVIALGFIAFWIRARVRARRTARL